MPRVQLIVKSLRASNSNKLTFTHLNTNSTRNKFEMLSDQIKVNIHVLIVSESKTDDSFPNGNFLTDGINTQYEIKMAVGFSEKIFLQTNFNLKQNQLKVFI